MVIDCQSIMWYAHKKKIGLFLKTEFSDGGVFQYNQAMLNAVALLSKDNFNVVIAYSKEHWLSYLNGYDISIITVPWGLSSRLLGKFSRYIDKLMSGWRKISPYFHPTIRALLAQKCDLWIFPSQDPLSYEAPLPSLVTIHDLMHRYERRFPEVSANGQYEWRERLYKHICRWSKGILVDSNVGRRHVTESYIVDSSKIHVLPYIPPKYVFSESKVTEFDKRYKIPPKFIFYPAHFWLHKNHRNLLKAAVFLKVKLPDLHLVFVGLKKNGYNDVKALIHELGCQSSVTIFEYVPNKDITEFYRRATALVMPTFFGPTNIPPLEAFALGCPVAVSNVYGVSEQVGDAVLLFNPNSIEEIACAIEILWKDNKQREELIVKGFIKSKKWNQQQYSYRLRAIVEKVLGQ